MPYSAQDIINRVRDTLIDPVPWTYYSDAALLGHLNNAIGAIVQIDKKAAVANKPVKLSSGVLQVLPADAVSLIEGGITRNMGTDGLTPGRGISVVLMEDMLAWRPRWSQDIQQKVVRHAMIDPDDPRRWYNWPPSDGTSYVEQKYVQVPDDLSVTVTNAVSAVSSGTVLTMSNTNGIAVGQMVQDLTTYYVESGAQSSFPIKQGTKVQSISAGVSVTLDTALQGSVGAGNWLSFADAFPIPDLYADPAYNFILAYAMDRNSTKSNPAKSALCWQRFMATLSTDEQELERLGIGHPAS